VDKKTIHNWIKAGRLDISRTEGGHVRIDAMQALRFLRSHGYPIPREFAQRKPRVVVIAASSAVRTLVRKALGRRVVLAEHRSMVEALLAFDAERPDALIIDPDTDRSMVVPLATSLVEHFPALTVLFFGVTPEVQGIPHATPGELARRTLELVGCA
jgi:hypothetical protein